MMKSIHSIFLIFLMSMSSLLLTGQSVNWLSWEEAMDKTELEPKKILVDIYTEWCTWCKKMEQTTFADPDLVEYLNDNYYSIKFDAQSKKPIVYKDKTYHLENSIWKGGYHQLTAVITNNQSTKLPTIVFLDEKSEPIQAIPGFRNAYEMKMMAAYFYGNYHKTTPWKKFVNLHHSQIQNGKSLKHDTSIQVHTRLVTQKRN